MLHPDKAREQLEAFKLKDHGRHRIVALKKLPKALSVAGLAILGRNPKGGTLNWLRRNKAQTQALRVLDEASARDRQRIFACLFPKLAPAMEATWQLLHQLPYQAGYARKAFRAPHDPAMTRSRRQDWLVLLINELEDYKSDAVTPAWIAAWAPYISGYRGADELGYLLAAVIDKGGKEGDEIFEILKASARGEHDTGAMGRHVSRALLVASRPDGWDFMEKMLLAAQRQEGLRQAILESIDEAHPQAFRRMMKLILDQNLIRFSSVVRAVDVWFALNWDTATPRTIVKTLEQVQTYMTDAEARKSALAKGNGEAVFLALWALAFDDAASAVKPAREVLRDKGLERRFGAISLLARLQLPAATPALLEAVEDADLRIAVTAFWALPTIDVDEEEASAFDATAGAPEKRFALVERLLARLPEKPPSLKPLVWPWAEVHVQPNAIADQLVASLGKQPLSVLLPYLQRLSSRGRYQIAARLGKMKTWDAQMRQTMFNLVNDRDSGVRRIAIESLKKVKISPEEGLTLEDALRRKASDSRRAVLTMLLKQPAEGIDGTTERLLSAKKANQRLGGLEMLRLQVESEKKVATCRERARQYQTEHPDLSDEEVDQIESILDTERGKYTLENGLGLLDPAKMTPPVAPTVKTKLFLTEAAVEILKSLDGLIHEHRDEPVTIERGDEPQEVLLGNYGFPGPDWTKKIDEDARRLPLLSVWEEWYGNRPKKLRDPDGLELLRAQILIESEFQWDEWKGLAKRPAFKAVMASLAGTIKPPKLRYENPVSELVNWLLRLHPPQGGLDWLLDAGETAFAMIPEKEIKRIPKKNNWRDDWRTHDPFQRWLATANELHVDWTDAEKLRRWQLQHWQDQPAPGISRSRPDLDVLLDGYRQGAANEADLLDDLLGPRDTDRWHQSFVTLSTLTMRKPHPALAERLEIKALVDLCRERILNIELKRGDTSTPATDPARSINSLFGVDTLLRLLARLGKRAFRESYYGDGKAEVLTHLIKVTYPNAEGTPEVFIDKVKPLLKADKFPPERLIELAFLAPQWVGHVARYLDWPGFEEGVWWYFGHMSAEPGHFEEEEEQTQEESGRPKPTQWERMLQERTHLSEDERRDGAVDVEWFHRVYEPLGKKRWEAIGAAAKSCGSRGAAKKSAYLANVILGKAKKRDLVSGIRLRNLRENVRLLGLLPLARGDNREKDLANRYKVLQGYRRYAKSLGPMSKEGALRTASIGLENMARTAGYPDPIRFEWAMEAKEIADLAGGPIARTVEGVTVTLALNDLAQPDVTVMRGDRTLKSIPPKVRKDRTVATLVERKADLRRQASRIRESLETMMCRGDTFTGKELQNLFDHPMLVPLLSRLVLLGDGIAGYPVRGGKALRNHTGKTEPVKANEALRLAHPHDLLTGGEWHLWQRECFASERVQPFKQVFRELYVLAAQETKDGDRSQRYAGQQVNPTQAQALFGARTWSTRDGIQKTFHQAGLTAEVWFRYGGFTPLEVEGWTLELVCFRKRGEWQPTPLKTVPPRIFSEVMRDLDLVVSVAHRGGVDPEASASTVEMREALLRETCSLLKLDNIRFKASHVLIDGQLANYTVHLGSAVVHRQPGGHLCIVPVHAQHRGRLFLPFADDDPKTAEVISKVIMLARDQEIQDPVILDQIRQS
jgi:hypothetical protein